MEMFVFMQNALIMKM